MAKHFDRLRLLVMAIVIGTASFLIIYGTTPLHTSNDNWIMAAIDEDDIVQHYAGWTMFRSGEWTFPIGMISEMARGTGTTIVYTDSIPWVAIFFKLLFQITGYTGDFQYFGLFTLLCFILQAYASGLLVQRKSKSLVYTAIAMGIFCFSPPLLDRTLRHTALGAHFIILFAMLTYFKCRDGGYTKFPAAYIVLAALSVGIHSYFLPMVMIFSLLTMVEGIIKNHKVMRWASQFILSCAAGLLSGYILGVFVESGDVSRKHYGYFNMNLLSPVNPEGGTGYTWSTILPSLGLVNGNYEGFNYLGFGIILLGVTLLILELLERILGTRWFPEEVSEHTGYAIIMLFLTLFAVSNVITIGETQLFTINLPKKLISLCGIFRSSGRLFYPVFYSIYLLIIYRLWDFASQNNLRTKKGRPCAIVLPIAVLVVAASLQLADLSRAVAEKHSKMAEAAFFQNLLDDASLIEMAEGCDYIVGPGKHRDVCVFAGLHGMGTCFSAATGGSWGDAHDIRDAYIEDLENGIHDGHTMFLTDEWTMAHRWADANPDMTLYQYEDRYFLAPAKKGE